MTLSEPRNPSTNDTGTSPQHIVQSEPQHILPSSLPSPSVPSSGVLSLETIQPHLYRSQQTLTNNVHLFSLFISVLSIFLNFWVGWEFTKSLGVTLGLMMWTLFGIVWCGGFAMLLGGMFTAVANFLGTWNVIPALGSSLWAFLSTFSIVAVLKDSMMPFAPIRNLPLFSFILANLASMGIRNEPNQSTWFLPQDSLFSSMTFKEGTATCTSRNDVFQFIIGRHCAISTSSMELFQNLQHRSKSQYNTGENMPQFERDFAEWKLHLPKFKRVFFMRRLICFLAFLIEATALFLSFMTLKRLFVNAEEAKSILIHLSFTETILCAFLSLFSAHLWAAVNVELTFSTQAEQRAMMLIKVQSNWIDWSGRGRNRVSFLTNGRYLRVGWWSAMSNLIPFREAATIGLFYDIEESRKAGAPILKSIEADLDLKVHKAGGLLLGTEIYDREQCEAQALQSVEENINWGEYLLS